MSLPVYTVRSPLRAVQVLPLTHAVALTRWLVAGTELSNPLPHVMVLLTYAAVSYYIAVVLVRRKLLV